MTEQQLTDKAAKIKAHIELCAEIGFATKRLERDTNKPSKLKEARMITFDQLTSQDITTDNERVKVLTAKE